MNVVKTPSHLGGHMFLTHIDRGAFYALKDRLQPETMLDVGCGPGGMRKIAKAAKVQWTGIDGDPQVAGPDIITHDFTQGIVPLTGEFDLGWSVEFVEHVDEMYLPNVMAAFRHCKVLCMTYAPPGWPGHHHVNCQPERYWIEQFRAHGFAKDDVLTRKVRDASEMVKPFMRERGLCFRRQ
jgi:SAM-dependent methyltransferase